MPVSVGCTLWHIDVDVSSDHGICRDIVSSRNHNSELSGYLPSLHQSTNTSSNTNTNAPGQLCHCDVSPSALSISPPTVFPAHAPLSLLAHRVPHHSTCSVTHSLTQAPITCMQIIHQETTRKAAASRAPEFASSSGFAPMSSVGAGLDCGQLRWRWRPMTPGTLRRYSCYPWRHQWQRHPPRPSMTRVLLHVY